MMEEQQPDEFKLYSQLREAEARIDATILRKRLDLLDALNRPLKVAYYWKLLITVSKEDSNLSEYDDFRSTMAINTSIGQLRV